MTREEHLLRASRSNRSRAGSHFASAAFARAARSGKEEKTKRRNFSQEWIEALAASARFWRTLVVVKRQFQVNGPSSLERGSAATRTVVRSISSTARWNELTHISRINRR